MGWFTSKHREEEFTQRQIDEMQLRENIEKFKDDFMFAKHYIFADDNGVILEFLNGSSIFSASKGYPYTHFNIQINLKEYDIIWSTFNRDKKVVVILDKDTDNQKMYTIWLNVTEGMSSQGGGNEEMYARFDIFMKYKGLEEFTGNLSVKYQSQDFLRREKIKKLDGLFCGLSKEDIKNYLDGKL